MDFPIHPYKGVGPIELGMTQDEVRKALNSSFVQFMKSKTSEMPTDAFDELGIHVYYKKSGVCKAVEFGFRPSHSVMFRGQAFFGRPYRELLDWLRAIDPAIEEDDTGLTSYKLGIALYAPDAEDDPDHPIESVFVFERGYYGR